jgi:hypothetical protein
VKPFKRRRSMAQETSLGLFFAPILSRVGLRESLRSRFVPRFSRFWGVILQFWRWSSLVWPSNSLQQSVNGQKYHA